MKTSDLIKLQAIVATLQKAVDDLKTQQEPELVDMSKVGGLMIPNAGIISKRTTGEYRNHGLYLPSNPFRLVTWEVVTDSEGKQVLIGKPKRG